tara:strand:- start:304 stop:1989 length:1686 start_codon:yes stop_codon:yes gene_type:complete
MTNSDLSSAPNDEIDLTQLIAALKRHWRLISKFTGSTFIVSIIYITFAPRIWEGEFQIVLASEGSGAGQLAQLAATNPILANIAGFAGVGVKDSLETEVKILESPSVLKPVFDFVRTKKQQAGQNVEHMLFTDWRKENVHVELEKGTSVLNISYTDTHKELVLPVIDRISREYQDYSGRDRRRDLANAVLFLKQSIARLQPKAEQSLRAAQGFALNNGLGLSDGVPVAAGLSTEKDAGFSVEANRQLAQAKVLLLKKQISRAVESGQVALFQAPQLEANAELYQQYQAVETRLNYLRTRLTDNDELVRNLQRRRQSLIGTLNRQTIGLLQGELSSAQAALDASTRPKEVVLKHRELVRQAVRYEKTLAELEIQLQLAELEQAKQAEPWQLISTPTLLDEPVAPRKLTVMALGLFAGLFGGSAAALVIDRRSGRVFSEDELQQLVPGPLLAHLEPLAMQGKLTLLAGGALSGSHRVGLIPVGLQPHFPQVKQVLNQLKEQLPHTELRCSRDLVESAGCDHQLLITRLGAPTRTELANLRQQLNLQGRPITGWLLLDDQVRAA